MLNRTVEAILFASGKPVPLSLLKTALGITAAEVEKNIEELKKKFNTPESGIHVLTLEGKVQLVSNPEEGERVAGFLKQELSGELTRPSLETLTIIAYRGPITKPEIEQIRGVNCSLILRNLLMRGLIEENEDKTRLQPVYAVSPDFLRHLGLHDLGELPEYATFHHNEKIDSMLEELQKQNPSV